MSVLSGLRARVRGLLLRNAADVELAEEIQFHIHMETEANIRRGMSPAEARRVARAHFGGVERVREEHRDGRRLPLVEDMLGDVRFALRSFMRTPGLAAAVVLTLALGLGANAAMFSILDRVFFRMPPGVAAPGEVHRLYVVPHPRPDRVSRTYDAFDYRQYAKIREAIGNTAVVATFDSPTRTQFGADTSRRVFMSFVGPDYFTALGIRPALGRFFAPDEERVESPADVMVLSYDFWQRQFAGDPHVLGRRFTIGVNSFTVVGVAQRGFAGVDLDAVDAWRPLSSFAGFGQVGSTSSAPPWYDQRGTLWLRILVRPRPGTAPDAIATRATIGERRANAAEQFDTLATVVTGSLISARGPAGMRTELWLASRLAGVAIIVLLIACANVTSLLLARALQRRREIAVRLALGISRPRLFSMLLVESVLLAVAAGVAALIAGAWTGGLLRALLLPDSHWEAPTYDARIAIFTGAAALFGALATGIAPALHATRTDVGAALQAGVREGQGHRSRMRAALVTAQSALAAVLLVGATLFVRTLHNARSVHTGYDVDRLVFAAVPEKSGSHDAEDAIVRDVENRVAHLPGVERAALVSLPPVWGFSVTSIYRANGDSLLERDGRTPTITGVSPGYFSTVGMRLLRGRDLVAGAALGAREIVVNAIMARQLWPGREAIGQCLRLGEATSPCYMVVGVVEDARMMNVLDEPKAQYYVSGAVAPSFVKPTWIAIRAVAGQTRIVSAEVRQVMRTRRPAEEPHVLVMSDLVGNQFRTQRLGAILFGAFAAFALVLAAMGVYSTLTYAIAQRTHEIGVRMALGARAADVVRLIVVSGVRLTAAGILVGGAIALLLGRVLATLLYGVTPHDPLSIAVAGVVLLTVAAIAAGVPAARAALVDPATALRADG